MDRQTERVKISEVCQFNNKKLLEEYFFQEMDRQTERVKISEVCQFNNKKLLEE